MNSKMRITVLLLCTCLLCCGFSSAEQAEESPWLTCVSPVSAGDTEMTLRLEETPEDLQVNVFLQEQEIAENAVLFGDLLTLSLKQPLCEGDELLILAAGTSSQGEKKEARLTAIVPPLFVSPLADLRNRADAMWEIWQESWAVPAEHGTVYLPIQWLDLPFVTWADEAPKIIVRRSEEEIRVYLKDPLPSGWVVRAGAGIPVAYTDCVWDEAGQAWTAKGRFDSVHLVSEMKEDRIGITIAYWEEDGFLPTYPVLEWLQESETERSGFNCYGLGTTRSRQGGFYSFVDREHVFMAEYDAEGALVSYMDMQTECAYGPDDLLVSGNEPAGYVNPVVH